MIVYFTYNDQPSGVYYSQVTNVVSYLNAETKQEVRLFALVSARSWRSSKKQIQKRLPNAIVWPMVPKAENWKLNRFLLKVFTIIYKPTGIISRGVFACVLALHVRRKSKGLKVCFDGRGAYAAEWKEYRIIDNDALINSMPKLERVAINESDFRIAVSHALVAHWQQEYGYEENSHVVIPCTLSSERTKTKVQSISLLAKDRITLVYAGSTAGWQSFSLLEKLLSSALENQANVQVLFLSREDENNRRLQEKFPGRVLVKWLKPEEVIPSMEQCDYGILIREDTVTNRVASPTKFAEYLNAGLRVLISEQIGDMSRMVEEHDLGILWKTSDALPAFEALTSVQRDKQKIFCKNNFEKRAFKQAYAQISENLT